MPIRPGTLTRCRVFFCLSNYLNFLRALFRVGKCFKNKLSRAARGLGWRFAHILRPPARGRVSPLHIDRQGATAAAALRTLALRPLALHQLARPSHSHSAALRVYVSTGCVYAGSVSTRPPCLRALRAAAASALRTEARSRGRSVGRPESKQGHVRDTAPETRCLRHKGYGVLLCSSASAKAGAREQAAHRSRSLSRKNFRHPSQKMAISSPTIDTALMNSASHMTNPQLEMTTLNQPAREAVQEPPAPR